MSHAFQQALESVSRLSPQEQVALIALLSQQVYESQLLSEEDSDSRIPEDVMEGLLARVRAYENGSSNTISGQQFRDRLREKYGM